MCIISHASLSRSSRRAQLAQRTSQASNSLRSTIDDLTTNRIKPKQRGLEAMLTNNKALGDLLAVGDIEPDRQVPQQRQRDDLARLRPALLVRQPLVLEQTIDERGRRVTGAGVPHDGKVQRALAVRENELHRPVAEGRVRRVLGRDAHEFRLGGLGQRRHAGRGVSVVRLDRVPDGLVEAVVVAGGGVGARQRGVVLDDVVV